MHFLNPLFLISLLSVPILLYLVLRKPRRRKLVFSQVFLFLRARREALSRISRLKFLRSLILFLEVLFLLFLSFSASTPLGNAPPFASNYAVVVLDTSLSMMARDVSPDRYSVAINLAREKIKELSSRGCPVSLWELSSQPRMLVGFTRNPHTVENALSEISPSFSGTEIMELLRLLEIWASPRVVEVFLFSDLAFSVLPERFPHLSLHQIKVGGRVENVAIVSADLQGNNLWVKIGNFGETEREVHLKVNGMRLLEPSSFWIEPMGTQEFSFTLNDSQPYIKVEIEEADVLPWDNKLYLVLPRQKTISLVSSTPFIESALQSLGMEVISVNPEDYTPDPRADLTIFEGFFPQKLPQTPLLIINPPPDNPLFPWEGVQTRGFSLSGNSPILAIVDLSSVFFYEVPRLAPKAFLPLAFWGDTPIIFQGEIDGTPTVIFSPDLNKTNFPLEPSFPVFLLNAVNFLTREKPIYGSANELNGAELLEPVFEDGFPSASTPGLYFRRTSQSVRFFSFSYLSEEESNLQKETEIERMGVAFGSPAFRDLTIYFLAFPLFLILVEELLRKKHG